MALGDWKKTKSQMDDIDGQIAALQKRMAEIGYNLDPETRNENTNAHDTDRLTRELEQAQAQAADLNNQKSGMQSQYQQEYDTDNQRGRMISDYEGNLRKQLAQNLAQNKAGANNRGLLYSGLKQGSDADAYGSAAGQMATYTGQVNQAQSDKLNQYYGQQANLGLDRYQLAADSAASDYKTALQRRQTALADKQRRQSTYGQLGGAMGAIGGAFLPI